MIFNLMKNLKTPCHVIDIDRIKENIESLSYINKKTDAKILFAIKGFSNDKIIPYFISSFDGISASSLYEARLGKEVFNKPIHTFSSAYKTNDFSLVHKFSDYIIFNSNSQLNSFISSCDVTNKKIGVRINPEFSEIEQFAINPCHEYSRFGITLNNLKCTELKKVTGLHFHSMCEQYDSVLEKTLNLVDIKFKDYLEKMNWLNIGGGQLYSDENYNIQNAISSINLLQKKYDLELFIEPCETVVLNSGYTIASVVDIVNNGMCSAILDLSAVCHLPNIVNSPYRCDVLNAFSPYEKDYTYRLCGCTCYAGDIFGDYSFTHPLDIGSKIVFLDTAAYSMVKNNYFNGITAPYYAIYNKNKIEIVKEYNYDVFLSIL